jgi:hypothetical protein
MFPDYQPLSILPNDPANLTPVTEESEYNLFSECPSTKPHIDNLKASLSRWLSAKPHNLVQLWDLRPQNNIPAPTLLFWFLLDFTTGNLKPVVNANPDSFVSEDSLLENLLLYLQLKRLLNTSQNRRNWLMLNIFTGGSSQDGSFLRNAGL